MDELLGSWGLGSDVVDAFASADVSLRSLKFLSDDAIRKLIPKEGPRCMFMHHFSEFKAKSPQSSSSASTSRGPTCSFNEAPSRKRSRLDVSTIDELLAVPSVNDLHEHLKHGPPGLIVLGYYKAKNHLDDYTRDLLGQESIYMQLKLKGYGYSFTREEFDKIADTIVEVFPNESKLTWYDVVTKKKRSTVLGRLRLKWYSIRRGMSSAMLIPKLRACDEVNDSSGDDTDVDDNEDLQELYGECQDWRDVERAWESTVAARKKVFKQCDFVIHSYVSKFPCLEKNLGWKLLADDGERTHESLKLHLELWNEAVPFLISQIQTVNPSFTCATGSEDSKFMSIIRQLSSLWRVKHLPKSPVAPKSRLVWRPSTDEISDSLCLHVLDIGLIRERINARKKTLGKYHYSLQPVAVVVGPLDQIRQSFIYLDEYRWEVDSPIDAVFGVLKICFGLDAKYPIESQHIWVFLQRVVFKITTSQDFTNGLRSHLAARLKAFDQYNSNNNCS